MIINFYDITRIHTLNAPCKINSMFPAIVGKLAVCIQVLGIDCSFQMDHHRDENCEVNVHTCCALTFVIGFIYVCGICIHIVYAQVVNRWKNTTYPFWHSS